MFMTLNCPTENPHLSTSNGSSSWKCIASASFTVGTSWSVLLRMNCWRQACHCWDIVCIPQSHGSPHPRPRTTCPPHCCPWGATIYVAYCRTFWPLCWSRIISKWVCWWLFHHVIVLRVITSPAFLQHAYPSEPRDLHSCQANQPRQQPCITTTRSGFVNGGLLRWALGFVI